MQNAPQKFNANAPSTVHDTVHFKPLGERSTSPIVADNARGSSPATASETTQIAAGYNPGDGAMPIQHRPRCGIASPFAEIGREADSGAGAGPGNLDVSSLTGAAVPPKVAAPFLGWNETTITLLRLYWHDGLSASEIGRRLGCKKNAVVGKVHRLRLPGRPSPIKRRAA